MAAHLSGARSTHNFTLFCLFRLLDLATKRLDLMASRHFTNWLKHSLLLLFACTLFSAPTLAKEWVIEQKPHTRVSIISAYDSLVAGEVQYFALKLLPEQGWHTYWRNPGEVGKATAVDWQLPSGVKPGELEWPMPTRKVEAGGISFVYPGEVILPFALAVGENLDFDLERQPFIAEVSWLVCKDVCIPEQATLEFAIPVALPGADRASLLNPNAEVIQDVLETLPKLRRDIVAEYDVSADGQSLLFQVAAEKLPAFVSQPRAYITEQAVVDETRLARVNLGEKFLTLSFKRDEYLDELPPFFGLILSGFSESDGEHLELHIENYPGLADGIAPELVKTLTAAKAGESSATELYAQAGSPGNILTILLFAFLGGLILNAMPCVFPVLSLKVISLVESGASDVRHRQQHGLAYTAGVVSSFALVALTLISLRGLGEQIGWGFQLQAPAFVAVVALVIYVLGLSMSGFIEIGSGLQNIGSEKVSQSGNPLSGAFWTGVLATVVATPCTAPFMGTAMGFALSQPLWLALLVFVVMGLGLASPFLLIAYVPALGSRLPRPGMWMVRFKELLAFPLYLTAVWLLWVFARQQGVDAAAVLLVVAVLVTMSIWAWTNARTGSMVWRGLASVFASLVMYAFYIATTQVGVESENLSLRKPDSFSENPSKPYSPETLAQALAQGDTVLVNMTADWCITCKVNERVALSSSEVETELAAEGVTYIKGDWTNSDPSITEYLARFGRNGVPLYVVYRPNSEPRVLPQILTPDIVTNALHR